MVQTQIVLGDHGSFSNSRATRVRVMAHGLIGPLMAALCMAPTLASAAVEFDSAAQPATALPGTANTAGPGNQELRPKLRNPDRVYGVVAGEADASAIVQNPANLGYLSGFETTVDVAVQSLRLGRAGSGAGVFIAFPLPFRLMAMGVGLQWAWRPILAGSEISALPYGKLSFAFALPLETWVPGLSIGLTASHFLSAQNDKVDGHNSVDVGVSWRASRFLALGFAARHINQPRIDGPAHAVELQPEIALRPASPRGPRLTGFELALGARINLDWPAWAGGRPWPVQPVVRMSLQVGPTRFYVSGEGVSGSRSMVGESERPGWSAQIQGGVEFFGSKMAVAGGPAFDLPASGRARAVGGSGRLRFSQHRFHPAVVPRPKRVARIVLLEYAGDPGLWRLLQELEALATDGATTLLIETRGHGFDYPQLEELRDALFRFRDRGRRKVVTYLDGGRLPDYFLASASDRIIAHPTSSLAVTGMVEHTYYYAELLEKLGIRSETLQVGRHKHRPEVFARSAPSRAVAEQRSQILVDRWNHVVREIAAERGVGARRVAQWIDSAPLAPRRAIELALVDDLADHDEIDEAVEAWLGRPVRIERAGERVLRPDDYGPPLQIALLHMAGEIVDGEGSGLEGLGGSRVGAASTVRQLVELRESRHVRAVVVRIDSPGGSTWAARSIERELRRLAKVKPVVVSFGNRATSAAFYIATAADYVLTGATTVTASIGAFHTRLDLSGALDKAGIGVDIRGLGRNSRMNSWCRAHAPTEKLAAMRELESFYDEFISRVADARAMSNSKVRQLAGGRSWSGVRALELGLADRYGGMREAVVWARRAVDDSMGEHIEVVTYPRESRGFAELREFVSQRVLSSATGTGARALLDLLSTGPLARVLRRLPMAIWSCGSDANMAMSYEIKEYE